MYLKSLTLKGFKSFASATTLQFEPGITCVVGPNGSGKSNVVDALSWVMGEQGAKALRGGKMEDVIFAGTSGRGALGRAEVTLTIDNTDGALPIEYSEVSITRRVFRDGASEYEINGASCRLMDVQELLSDSGIGREMHVIVGQGQLAHILESRPEDLRAYIEEAAGVLKHRRRKEKALRKLNAMQANLSRLSDLTGELRRQLKPLARQADVARRAQVIQADVRDAKLRIAADDVVQRRVELADQQHNETLARERAAAVREKFDTVNARVGSLASQAETVSPRAEEASQVWFTLSSIAERVNATIRVARERERHLTSATVAQRGQDPDELDAQAEHFAQQENELNEAVLMAEAALETVREELAACEDEAATAEREHLAAVRAIADRREGLARLAGKVENLQTRVESFDAEVSRFNERIADAQRRNEAAQEAFDATSVTLAEHEAVEEKLDRQYERARATLAKAENRVKELRDAERGAGHEVVSLTSRIDTLSAGLRRADGPTWLHDHHSGVGARLPDVVQLSTGYEVAISAALGAAADAVTSLNSETAADALSSLREADRGRAVIMIDIPPTQSADNSDSTSLPQGAVWAADLVAPPQSLAGAVRSRLAHTVVVDDNDLIDQVLASHPTARVVTLSGEIYGTGWVEGGTAQTPSTLEVQADIASAKVQLNEATTRARELSAALAGAVEELDDRRHALAEAHTALAANDTAITQTQEELARLGHSVRGTNAEREHLISQRLRAEAEHDQLISELTEHEERLRRAQSDSDDDHDEAGTSTRREAAAHALAAARAAEVDARLGARTAEERANAVRGRAESLRRAARAERDARARAEQQQRRREAAARTANVIVQEAEMLAHRLAKAVSEAAANRDALSVERDGINAELLRERDHLHALNSELHRLNDAMHRDEVIRAEAALRVEQLEEQVLEQFGIAADDLIAEYGPDSPLPPSALELHEYQQAKERGELVSAPQPMKYERTAQKRRLAAAERDLAALGKVNPLALEEFAALEERYNFLSTQLEDVRAARQDLLGVVDDVDKRILQLFTDAYYDVEREFVTVFRTLFPGGDGRLVLTDPADMLTTGIEVQARPPGKKVKRLSLLSGGEKSLTAVALLVAIFRARPSPFYVMDEVEAALDDTNLRRLIHLFEQLRETSQLIVITHQKTTMEVADALYGVSMRGDGITTVISQRLRNATLAQRPAAPTSPEVA
ncbi:chromosome segregation protein SMC [Hoyosella rhizosphaerae]|uniref:Chromosome partition protein Smc n=1 Tax=Hoyosella rhizosphaerae TaxID=1755582 RepID=A0A916TYS0_9ACTN|nr:chromosome segregation protein SMC [Hoyosella rhizosphaerae]MBN4927306.1 chromosome segregation protein SMC [Hoyosella rhizosphaerae]GGC52327.1 chromosome partition protein Smc [Hoyosella rhizosphaerae]